MTITCLIYLSLMYVFSGHVLCNLIEIALRYSDTTNRRTRTFEQRQKYALYCYSYRQCRLSSREHANTKIQSYKFFDFCFFIYVYMYVDINILTYSIY